MNQDIADILNEMADILEMQGVQWKPNAYKKAARELESLETDFREIYNKDGISGLKNLPGIGEHIANKIEEYIKTGKIKAYEKLKKSIPNGVGELLRIPSLGPKKVWQLVKKAKIHSLKDLKKAIKQGKIKNLKGFGEKSQSEISKGVSMIEAGSGKNPIYRVLPLALEIKKNIEKVKGVKKVEIAGSLRRMKEVVGDIDILVTSDYPEKVMDVFTKMDGVSRILAKGSTKSAVMFSSIQADVRVLKPEVFGAALQYFTGSKEHNVAVRKIAIKKGYKLSEYGLFERTGKLIAAKDEEIIYKRLGMSYVPPQLRELSGELEAAMKNKIPKLVELNEINGDLHMHTKASDGMHSIAEMAKAAKEKKYEYIAITDHSKSEHIANGLDEKRLSKHLEEIAKTKVSGLKIFRGSEVDILKNGDLDYDNKTLKQLDIVIASIHSGFKSSKEAMTKRICSALQNPYVKILAHPTGRVVLRRNPYEVNLDKVFAAAKERGIALEINCPRLDLRDIYVKKAVESGCKLVINTDSHSTDQLNLMQYGVGIAQRGWAQSKNIINTLPLKQFEKWLK